MTFLQLAVGIASAATLAASSPRQADGPANLRVIARDYAFGSPSTIPAGPTTFRLINEGTVRHEMQLYRFKPGISRDSAFRMLATDNLPEAAIDVDGGVLIAGPADSPVQELLTPLRLGDVYALECIFRDGPHKPRHRDIGHGRGLSAGVAFSGPGRSHRPLLDRCTGATRRCHLTTA